MRTNLFKSLLVAVMAIGAMGGVNAEEVLLTEDFSNSTYNVTFGPATNGGGTEPSIKEAAFYVENGKQSGDRSAYISFGEKKSNGSSSLSFDMALSKAGTTNKNNTISVCESIENKRHTSGKTLFSITQDYQGNITIGNEKIGSYSGVLLTYKVTLNTITNKAIVSVYNKETLIKTVECETQASGIGSIHIIVNKSWGSCKVDNIKLAKLTDPAITLSDTEVKVKENSVYNVSLSDIVGTVSVTSDAEDVATASVKDNKIEVNSLTSGVAHLTVKVANDGLEITKEITVTVGDVEKTVVSVKYVCEGNDIADQSSITDIAVGSTLNNEDLSIPATLFNTDKSIRYVNPVTDKTLPYTVEKDGIITISYTAQALISSATVKYTYNGTEIASENVTISEGKYEGDNYTLPFRYMVKDNGTTVYKTKNNSSNYYGESVTLSKDMVIEKTLTKAYDNVAFLVDLDDTDGENAGVRASNCSAYNNKTYKSTEVVAPGIYTVFVRVQKKDRGSYLTIGDKTVYEFDSELSKGTWVDQIVENVEIKNGGIVAWNPGSGRTYDPIDIIMLIKTGDATETVSVSNAGYATFATNYNVKVPEDENVKVMTVEVNAEGTAIELHEVAANTVIPANTGILVKATQGDYNFVVTSDADEKLPINNLVAATTDVPSDGVKYFALTTLSDGKVGFAKVAKDVNIPAGKAYLMVENGSPAKFFGLDGEATGINSVKTAKADGAYYTLEGVKTTKPVKGLYIHNGKKIVVK